MGGNLLGFTRFVYSGVPTREQAMTASTIGVMAVDPGGSTGVVWGMFDLSCPSIKTCLSTAYWESETITGTELTQAKRLCDLWRKLNGQPTSIFRLVLEDYIQKPTLHVVDPESLMPIRVAWTTIGMMEASMGALAPRPIFQQPGDRMPESRLKAHDAWIRGRGHERAAMGHMLTFLSARLK